MKLQHDVEGHSTIPQRKCSPCVMQFSILMTVMVLAFAGTVFYYSIRPEIDPESLDLTYVEFNNGSLLAISEGQGSPVMKVHNKNTNVKFRDYEQIGDQPDVTLTEHGQFTS